MLYKMNISFKMTPRILAQGVWQCVKNSIEMPMTFPKKLIHQRLGTSELQ